MPAPHLAPEQLLQHQDWLFRLVRKLVRDDFTADDMVQATLTEALADDSAGSSNLQAWLGSTARRLTAQHWRSSMRRQEREQEVAVPDHVVVNHSSELTGLFDIANRALYDLPEEERVVLMLRHMQGWKPGRIAKELGIPVARVYRVTEQGCKKLRQRLQGHFGKDWRGSCLAILGVPLPRASATLLPVAAAVAVCVSVLLGGFWIFNLLPSAATPIPRDLAALEMDSDILLEMSPEAALLEEHARILLPPPPSAQRSFRFQVLDPENQPMPETEVMLSWRNGTWFGLGSDQAMTDAEGLVTLTTSLEAEELQVSVYAEGLFFEWRKVPLAAVEEITVLPLIQGTIPVSFQTAPLQEGDTLLVSGSLAKIGCCTTDAAGRAEILLPGPGRYSVRRHPSRPGWPMVEFYVEEHGTTDPIRVSYAIPTAFTLIAVADQAGQVLEDAEFSIYHTLQDENGLRVGAEDLPLTSIQGVLEFEGLPPNPSGDWIHVEADGHLDTFLRVVDHLSHAVEIPLLTLEQVPAVVHLSDPEREVRSLVLHYGGRSMEFPTQRDSIEITQWFDILETTLDVTSGGEFLLPRVVGGGGSGFCLEATDDLGQKWLTPLLAASESEGPAPDFHLVSTLDSDTTVRVLGGKQASWSVIYSLSMKDRLREDFGPAQPDEEGLVHVATIPGETFGLRYTEPGLDLLLQPILPTGSNTAHFEVLLPQRDSRLVGRVFGPDGRPFPDSTVTATFLDPIPVLGPGDPGSASLTFGLKVRDGQIQFDGCCAGSYELQFQYRGLSFRAVVDTDETFELRMPAARVFSMRIRDAHSGLPLRAQLIRTDWVSGESRKYLAHSDRSSGFLSCAVYEPIDTSTLLLTAKGYQPVRVDDMLPDQVNLVDLEPARRIEVDLASLGLNTSPGGSWTVEAWGSVEDPRQSLVLLQGGTIVVSDAPLADFLLLEQDSEGEETDRAIRIHADGTQEVL